MREIQELPEEYEGKELTCLFTERMDISFKKCCKRFKKKSKKKCKSCPKR